MLTIIVYDIGKLHKQCTRITDTLTQAKYKHRRANRHMLSKIQVSKDTEYLLHLYSSQ